jgi:ribosomal protein L22
MNTNPVDRRRGARAFGDVLRTVRSNAGSARGVDPTKLVSDTIARLQEKG